MSDLYEIDSRLVVLCRHLLKWQRPRQAAHASVRISGQGSGRSHDWPTRRPQTHRQVPPGCGNVRSFMWCRQVATR